jgi:hypothetical protein
MGVCIPAKKEELGFTVVGRTLDRIINKNKVRKRLLRDTVDSLFIEVSSNVAEKIQNTTTSVLYNTNSIRKFKVNPIQPIKKIKKKNIRKKKKIRYS